MIVIRTDHDIQTHYLYVWSEKLIKKAESKNFNIVKIEGKDITEEVMRSRIKHKQPKFIFFNGHGNTTSLFDNEKQPFIDLNSSGIFSKTVTFARACDCLIGLGRAAINNGCKAFIGYKRKFWIARHHKRECSPFKDEIAKPVMECSDIVVEELIKGNTVEGAVNKSHEKSADNILKLIYSKEPLSGASLQAVVANDAALDFEGISTAKIC